MRVRAPKVLLVIWSHLGLSSGQSSGNCSASRVQKLANALAAQETLIDPCSDLTAKEEIKACFCTQQIFDGYQVILAYEKICNGTSAADTQTIIDGFHSACDSVLTVTTTSVSIAPLSTSGTDSYFDLDACKNYQNQAQNYLQRYTACRNLDETSMEESCVCDFAQSWVNATIDGISVCGGGVTDGDVQQLIDDLEPYGCSITAAGYEIVSPITGALNTTSSMSTRTGTTSGVTRTATGVQSNTQSSSPASILQPSRSGSATVLYAPVWHPKDYTGILLSLCFVLTGLLI